MTPVEAADAVHPVVYPVGSGFMLDGATYAVGAELGFPGLSFYFVGRCGVLGPADADVVVAAIGMFEPGVVRSMWEVGLPFCAPDVAARAFAGCCAKWGVANIPDDAADLPRLAELAERVIDAASPVGLPLFAGWRALARPDDPRARVAHAMQLLRELRGGAHVVAMVGEGMSAPEAIAAGTMPESAAILGWRQLDVEVDDALAARRARVEELTTAITARPFEVLDEAERDELVGLVEAVGKRVLG